MKRLTGARAWTLAARVKSDEGFMHRFDCLDIDDWRKHSAIRNGTVVERYTV